MAEQTAARRHALVAATLILGLHACDGGDRRNNDYPPAIRDQAVAREVMIVAHRGGMAYAPENTVEAMQNGLRLGADMLELDVQVRANDIFVLHDFTLDRTTNCVGEAYDTSTEVRNTCDAGFRWQPSVRTYPAVGNSYHFRGKGIRIPLLEEVIEATADANTPLFIELKHVRRNPTQLSIEQAVDALLTLIVQRSAENRVWINSSNRAALARVEAIAPGIRTILSWGSELQRPCEETVLDAVTRAIDGVLLQTHVGLPWFEECVKMAQDAGLNVILWTVNRPADVERLLPLRPDGLLTDFPACLAAMLRDVRVENPYPPEVQRGDRLPKCDW